MSDGITSPRMTLFDGATKVWGDAPGGGDTIPPTAPGRPVASNTTSTSAALTWTASTDNVAVTGYDVYRGTTLAGTSTTNSFNATGLTGSTQYSFTVVARDAAGNTSTPSPAVTFTTLAPEPDNIAPSRPGQPTASGITTTGATLTWAASTDNIAVTGYDIYRGTTLAGTSTTTTFSATGL